MRKRRTIILHGCIHSRRVWRLPSCASTVDGKATRCLHDARHPQVTHRGTAAAGCPARQGRGAAATARHHTENNSTHPIAPQPGRDNVGEGPLQRRKRGAAARRQASRREHADLRLDATRRQPTCRNGETDAAITSQYTTTRAAAVSPSKTPTPSLHTVAATCAHAQADGHTKKC